jgi:hypothetical protein
VDFEDGKCLAPSDQVRIVTTPATRIELQPRILTHIARNSHLATSQSTAVTGGQCWTKSPFFNTENNGSSGSLAFESAARFPILGGCVA